MDPAIVPALFAWLHLLAAGVAAGLLLTEYWLCRRPLDRGQVRLLGTVDLGYFLALIASLATGLARALYFAREPDFYLSNRLFWLKIIVLSPLAWWRSHPPCNTSAGTARRVPCRRSRH